MRPGGFVKGAEDAYQPQTGLPQFRLQRVEAGAGGAYGGVGSDDCVGSGLAGEFGQGGGGEGEGGAGGGIMRRRRD